jgi:membrane protein DedA with SNARE-associated domain
VQGFLIHVGYAALILFAFLEACCVPISSEAIFGFAGVLAYQGHLNLALVIVTGTLAELAGSYVSYLAGRLAGRPAIERLGRFVLITRSDINRTERFLTRGATWAIPLGRAMPLVRSFTSLVAGFGEIPALRFGFLSLIGTVVYVAAVASIGYGAGSAWSRIAGEMSVAGYVIGAIAVAVLVALVSYRVRELRRDFSGNPGPLGPDAERTGTAGTDRRLSRHVAAQEDRHRRDDRDDDIDDAEDHPVLVAHALHAAGRHGRDRRPRQPLLDAGHDAADDVLDGDQPGEADDDREHRGPDEQADH